MVDRNEAFVREVDEELRREQLQKLWQQYGIYIVGVAALILVGVGGYKWQESRRHAASEAAGARFEAAQRLAAEGKQDEAIQAFSAIAKDAPGGYPALANLQVANAQVKAGKTAEAVAIFESVAKAAADPLLRDFAALEAAMLRLDKADYAEMETRLTPLLGEKSAWRAMARETLALAVYKAGKKDEARKLFEQTLSDRTSPQSVAERAQVMLSLLTDADAAGAAPVVTTVPPVAPAKKEPEKAGKGQPPPAKKN